MTEILVTKAELRRPYNFDTLADIVPDETPLLPKRPNGDLVVTFDADLSAEQVAAIRLRMTTVSDAEAEQVTALSAAARGAREWKAPAVSKKANPAAPTSGDLAVLAAQVEALSTVVADLTHYVLTKETL
jgi:hypothetical protein